MRILFWNLLFLILGLLTVEGLLTLTDKSSLDDRRQELARHYGHEMQSFSRLDGPTMGLLIAHPFWGIRQNPGTKGMNNLGFLEKFRYPYQKQNPDELVIGLFGGSMAQRTARYLQTALENTARQLHCKLKLRVLNFAIGGSKQPSQFNIYHTFYETIDASINIDGHNDVSFLPGVRFPPYYPVLSDGLYELGSKRLQALQRSYNLREKQAATLRFLADRPWLLHSRLASRLLFSLQSFLHSRAQSVLKQVSANDTALPGFPADDRERQKILVDNWAKYVSLQAAMAKQSDKPAFFFVQPTMHLPESNPKRTDRLPLPQTMAADERHLVQRGYELLLQKVPGLKKSGVQLFDYSRLFSDIKEPVFADDCCHLNETGSEILSERMADVIGRLLLAGRCQR